MRLACARASLWVLGSGPASALRKNRVRVVTWNIHAWRDSAHVDNFDRVCAALKTIDADIVCLNEVLEPFDGAAQPVEYWADVLAGRGRGRAVVEGHHHRTSYLDRVAGTVGYDVVLFARATQDDCYFGRLPFGNAVLARTAAARLIEAGEVHMAAEPGDMHLGEQERAYVEDRSCCYATFDLGGPRLTVGSVHLDHKSEDLRLKQVGRVADALQGKTNCCLLGDLNTFQRRDHTADEWARIVDLYVSRGWGRPAERSLSLDFLQNERGFLDARAVLAPDAPTRPTCWTTDPRFRIDHILFAPDLARATTPTGDYQVHGDVTASDHFPVSFDLPLS